MGSQGLIVPDDNKAQEILNRINALKANMMENVIDLAELLTEIRQNNYFQNYGYTSFKGWIENSGLDMSERNVYYLMTIYTKSKELGISKEELKNSKISKLREIFTLQSAPPSVMRKLVAASATESLPAIRDRVNHLKKEAGEEPFVYINLRMLAADFKSYWEPAIQVARIEAGTSSDPMNFDIAEISQSQAIVHICQDYLADPNRRLIAAPVVEIQDAVEVHES